jgi:hypothetical protein
LDAFSFHCLSSCARAVSRCVCRVRGSGLGPRARRAVSGWRFRLSCTLFDLIYISVLASLVRGFTCRFPVRSVSSNSFDLPVVAAYRVYGPTLPTHAYFTRHSTVLLLHQPRHEVIGLPFEASCVMIPTTSEIKSLSHPFRINESRHALRCSGKKLTCGQRRCSQPQIQPSGTGRSARPK